MQSFVGVLFILVLFDAAGAVFKIKVSKFESERNRQLRLGIAPDHSVFTSEPKSLTPHDYYDLEYTATVYLGSEKTPIRVVLDTGSADFWVPDVTCGICDYYCHGLNAEFCAKLCAQGCCDVNNNFTTSKCLGKQFFDAKTSSTYQVHNGTFRLKYGAGEASGFYGSDILDFAGLQTRVIFGQVTEIDAVIKYDTNFDGILGLAFQSLSIDKTPPPFVAAFRQGLVESPVFTAFLRKGGFRNMQDGGEFTFGGFDGDNCDYSDLKYVKLTYPAYYQFALDGFNFGTFEVSGHHQVISDTGTSFIGAPQYVVEQVVTAIGATVYPGGYRVPCDARAVYPEMQFVIDGTVYTVSSEDYILQVGASLCEVGMAPLESSAIGPKWIFGDVFIRQYCNVYDLGEHRIGFAKPIETE